jgi:hypothetical protein
MVLDAAIPLWPARDDLQTDKRRLTSLIEYFEKFACSEI